MFQRKLCGQIYRVGFFIWSGNLLGPAKICYVLIFSRPLSVHSVVLTRRIPFLNGKPQKSSTWRYEETVKEKKEIPQDETEEKDVKEARCEDHFLSVLNTSLA